MFFGEYSVFSASKMTHIERFCFYLILIKKRKRTQVAVLHSCIAMTVIFLLVLSTFPSRLLAGRSTESTTLY